jgi:hypothetical protein
MARPKPGDTCLRRWPIWGCEGSECPPNRSPFRPAGLRPASRGGRALFPILRAWGRASPWCAGRARFRRGEPHGRGSRSPAARARRRGRDMRRGRAACRQDRRQRAWHRTRRPRSLDGLRQRCAAARTSVRSARSRRSGAGGNGPQGPGAGLCRLLPCGGLARLLLDHGGRHGGATLGGEVADVVAGDRGECLVAFQAAVA